MISVIRHPRAFLFNGDSAELPLKPNTIDAIVCDPPAGVSFMGKSWDGDKGGRDQWVEWLANTLAPAFVALKPGGYGLVWALPRTSHWTALALELAGFEIRDRVSHLFGTGFPKSATAKSGGLPEGTGTALKPACEDWWLVRKPFKGNVAANVATHGTGVLQIDACRIGTDGGTCRDGKATEPNAAGWANMRGHGVAELNAGRWPANVVLSHTDGCRVVGRAIESVAKNVEPVDAEGDAQAPGWRNKRMTTTDVELSVDVYECAEGCPVADLGDPSRYFASFQGRQCSTCATAEAVESLSFRPETGQPTVASPAQVEPTAPWAALLNGVPPENSAEHTTIATASKSEQRSESNTLPIQPFEKRSRHESKPGEMLPPGLASPAVPLAPIDTTRITIDRWTCDSCVARAISESTQPNSDPGDQVSGAERYIYCAKPSPAERDLGCDGLPVKSGAEATDSAEGAARLNSPRTGAGRGGGRRNYHPTVKSIALMRWLVRLITPPGGVVLDPFAGSGTTALAALAEGCRFVGCEADPEYIKITEARILSALKESTP